MNDPALHRDECCAGPVIDPQLGIDVLQVRFDGLSADAESRGDLLISKASGYLIEDFELARGQAGVRDAAGQLSRDLRGDGPASGVDGANGPDQFLVRCVLREEGDGARLKRR